MSEDTPKTGRHHGRRREPGSSGFSLIEVLFAISIVATVAAVTLAQVEQNVSVASATAAARYVAASLQRARLDAISRNAHVALRVRADGDTFATGKFVDGDGDGVLSADIQEGIDVALGADDRLTGHFPGVDFGALPGLPPVDPHGTPPGDDPVRLGASDMAVFTPLGSATSGTLYLRGRGRVQLAVRIFGETGRTRILRFHEASSQWQPLSNY
jgi:prepilin-type N-terminal cleavage/methylation domain-containing protein